MNTFTNTPPSDLKDQIDGEGVVFRIESMDKYLAQDQFISSGKCHKIQTKTPRQFQYDWEIESRNRREGIEEEDTKATKLGSAWHTLSLEGNTFSDHYTIFNPDDRPDQAHGMTSNVNKDWKAKMKAQAAIQGKTILSVEELEIISAQRTELFQHPISSDLLQQKGVVELSIYTSIIWGDRTYYVRIRPDFISFQRPFYIDLKRTRNASPDKVGFPRDAFNYGYDIKVAMYYDIISMHWDRLLDFMDVEKTEHNAELKHSIIIAMENEAPYNQSVYKIPAATMEIGRYRYRAGLDRFNKCLTEGEWPGYEMYSEDQGIIDLILPSYAGNEIVV